MTRWEYKEGGVDNIIELNRLGAEGWELIQIHDAYDSHGNGQPYRRGLFKRPVSDNRIEEDPNLCVVTDCCNSAIVHCYYCPEHACTVCRNRAEEGSSRCYAHQHEHLKR